MLTFLSQQLCILIAPPKLRIMCRVGCSTLLTSTAILILWLVLLYPQSVTFDWSAETRSLVLGSFYYGYAVSQVPGGLLSTYWRPQHVFGLTISLSGLLCALMPLLAVWNVNLLITSRFLMGFLQVGLFRLLNIIPSVLY